MIAWQRELETATTAQEVVQLTRAFVAALPESEIAALPAELKVRDVRDEEELHAWSRRLNDAYWQLREEGREAGIIQEIWSFFLRATIRLSRVRKEQLEHASH